MAKLPELVRVNKEDGKKFLDDAARQFLDMSADEFIASWDAGEFNGSTDSRDVMRVARLLPLGR